MCLFGCASDEQFSDELEDSDEVSKRDYDLHYCESHDSYYCEEIDFCNPSKNCFPAMEKCRAYRSRQNAGN